MNKNTLQSLLLNMAIFEEVAAQGSFSSAADALQMTPSSVSKRMTQLEHKLGTKLIERTTRSMRLTNTGEVFLKHCQSMLKEANLAVEVASQSQESLMGDVKIGVPKAFAHQVLGPVFLTFLEQYPAINLQVVVTDDPLDLLRENIDCAIEIAQTPSEYLIAKPLKQVRQILCATPYYLASHAHPIHCPEDLRQHDCLYLGERPDDRQWRFTAVNGVGIGQKEYGKEKNHIKEEEDVTVSVTGRYAVNHSSMRLEGVLHHLGVGALPDFVAAQSLQDGLIIEVLPDWRLQSKYQGTAWLAYLPNKYQSLRLRTLLEFLKDNVR